MEGEAERGGRRGADGEGELPVRDLPGEGPGPGDLEPEPEPGTEPGEVREDGGDLEAGRRLDGTERDLTGSPVAELVGRAPQGEDRVPDALGHCPQRLASGGEPDAPALALEEGESEVPLQLLDVEGDGGLGAAQRAGGGEEGPRLEHRRECFEMSKIHA